ncbi:hypothetical protein F5148DRAFT_1151411 [Russula earlei]|uniref:Uncharacterized protein n=1 Tax=Russula earlei TaxID=71964 RepID=A0ACC0U0A9_9AGAM|nr:hypothetical protein F5148DRAFT_1151411 [Russula earlei]
MSWFSPLSTPSSSHLLSTLPLGHLATEDLQGEGVVHRPSARIRSRDGTGEVMIHGADVTHTAKHLRGEISRRDQNDAGTGIVVGKKESVGESGWDNRWPWARLVMGSELEETLERAWG